MIQFDVHIFQMGWFNHQLDDDWQIGDARRLYINKNIPQKREGMVMKWIGSYIFYIIHTYLTYIPIYIYTYRFRYYKDIL